MTQVESMLTEEKSLSRDLKLAIKNLRAIEWSGSAGRCPCCNEWPAIPERNVNGGHLPDCALAEMIS